ncbi:MAG: DUF697 domain-containing protein [Anaerolineales bacterium]|nr:DUF697 domain-containing protein [Anaerolineales bacterium]
MTQFFRQQADPPEFHDGWGGDGWQPEMPGLGWLDSLRSLWQWDELAAEIGQESRARIALIGLAGAGKSLLFNRLRGWDLSGQEAIVDDLSSEDVHVEPYGFFVLADLPTAMNGGLEMAEQLMYALGDPALLVYLIDATRGVRPADYRWVATLRASGRPLVVVLNKIDELPAYAEAVSQAEQRLGMPVLPISALEGFNVMDRFLPGLLDAAPRLAVPLGRELAHLRRIASRRVIRQVAVFAGMVGAQPIPLLDLPFQAMMQVGMVLRIGAAYGRTPTGGVSREIISTVISSLGLRYLATALIKVVPLLGWAVGGLVSAASTAAIGEVAIRYYEAGGAIPLPQLMSQLSRRPRQLEEPAADYKQLGD